MPWHDYDYSDGLWRPSAHSHPSSPEVRDAELRALNPDFPVLHLLGDLEHEQWIFLFEPCRRSMQPEDSEFGRLMAKSFEELTDQEREDYCTKWASIARWYIQAECRTRISPARFELMERQEWAQAQEWARYMFRVWTPEKLQRWRRLARTRYAALTAQEQASDRDMARKSLYAATGLEY